MADNDPPHVDPGHMAQFRKWVIPTFEIILDQAVKAMGAQEGQSAVLAVHLEGAASMMLAAVVPDPKATFLQEAERAWERIVAATAAVEGNAQKS